ncbi:MAG: electron transport complex subunit RsxE [Candidatus Aureabacteria bacterium]|nr:electron transport complex subunit RsxE [Candidatus Auribacterota bacterium]
MARENAEKTSHWKEFTKGIVTLNPIFVIVLGLCPTLAVSVSISNALGMGAAATFVLLGSNIVIAALMRFLDRVFPPELIKQVQKIRIPIYIVIIASFVTIVDLVMHGFAPALYARLGIYVPLIVVNCIILGRAEAFAATSGVLAAVLDALGMGVGFTLALLLLSTVREIIGAGKFYGYLVFGAGYQPMLIMTLAPGALLTFGLFMGLFRHVKAKRGDHEPV